MIKFNESWINNLIEFIFRWKFVIIAISAVLTIFMFIGSGKLKFSSDYEMFFDKENQHYKALSHFERVYGKTDTILFVVIPKNNNVFSKENLVALNWLTQEGWKLPFAKRVDSIVNFQHAYSKGDDILVKDFSGDEKYYTPEIISKMKEMTMNEKMLAGRLVSKKGHVAGVMVSFEMPNRGAILGIAPSSIKMKSEFEKKFSTNKVLIGGTVMYGFSYVMSAIRDNRVLTPLMYGLVLLFSIILLRSITGTIAIAIVMFFSIMFSKGLTGWYGIKITTVSTIAPTIIMTLAVADSIHIILTMIKEMKKGLSKIEALRKSFQINFKAVLITSLTTLVGFLSFNFSEVPPYRHLGNMIVLGVFAAWMFSVFLLPALMLVLPVRVRVTKEKDSKEDILMNKLSNFVINKRKIIIVSITLVLLVLILFIPRLKLNDSFVEQFAESVPFRKTAQFVEKNLMPQMLINYSLTSSGSGKISDPAYLKKVDEFARWLEKQTEVVHVECISDIMKRLNRTMHGNDQKKFIIPENQELAAQYLLLYEMSLPRGLDLNNMINNDKSSTRLTVTLKNVLTAEAIAFEKRADDWLMKNAPTMRTVPAGGLTMFFHINYSNIKSMLKGTLLTILLITLVMIIAIGNIKLGLLTLLPNILPILMTFGLWGLFIERVDLAVAFVAIISIGIIVDDTTHFFIKYLQIKREKGFSQIENIHYTFKSVGRAMITTSVVLVAGFLVMSLSTYRMNWTLGIMTSITIVLALIFDLFITPLLFLYFDKGEKNETL